MSEEDFNLLVSDYSNEILKLPPLKYFDDSPNTPNIISETYKSIVDRYNIALKEHISHNLCKLKNAIKNCPQSDPSENKINCYEPSHGGSTSIITIIHGKENKYILKGTLINYNNFNINLKMKKSFNVLYYDDLMDNYYSNYYKNSNILKINELIQTKISNDIKTKTNFSNCNLYTKILVPNDWSNCFNSQLIFHPSIVYNTIKINHRDPEYKNTEKNNEPLVRRFNTYFASGNHPYINQTIQHIILNSILLKEYQANILKQSPLANILKQYQTNILKQYSAFICEKGDLFPKEKERFIGYNITPMANYDTLDNFIITETKSFIEKYKAIFQQILNPLGFLKQMKYGFCHNDLKCKNIFIHKNKNKLEFNHNNKDNLEFKIADFDKSSIFYNGIRFYPTSSTPKLTTGLFSINSNKDNIQYYSLNSFGALNLFNIPIDQIFIFYTSKPMPMSFDYYILMISIIRNLFHAYVKQNVKNPWNEIIKLDVVKDILLLFKLHDNIDKIFNNYFEYIYTKYPEEADIKRELNSLSNIFVFLHKNQIKMLVNIDEFLNKIPVALYSGYDSYIVHDNLTIMREFNITEPIKTIVANGTYHNDIEKCLKYKNKNKIIQDGTVMTGYKRWCATDKEVGLHTGWDHVGHND